MFLDLRKKNTSERKLLGHTIPLEYNKTICFPRHGIETEIRDPKYGALKQPFACNFLTVYFCRSTADFRKLIDIVNNNYVQYVTMIPGTNETPLILHLPEIQQLLINFQVNPVIRLVCEGYSCYHLSTTIPFNDLRSKTKILSCIACRFKRIPIELIRFLSFFMNFDF